MLFLCADARVARYEPRVWELVAGALDEGGTIALALADARSVAAAVLWGAAGIVLLGRLDGDGALEVAVLAAAQLVLRELRDAVGGVGWTFGAVALLVVWASVVALLEPLGVGRGTALLYSMRPEALLGLLVCPVGRLVLGPGASSEAATGAALGALLLLSGPSLLVWENLTDAKIVAALLLFAGSVMHAKQGRNSDTELK